MKIIIYTLLLELFVAVATIPREHAHPDISDDKTLKIATFNQKTLSSDNDTSYPPKIKNDQLYNSVYYTFNTVINPTTSTKNQLLNMLRDKPTANLVINHQRIKRSSSLSADDERSKPDGSSPRRVKVDHLGYGITPPYGYTTKQSRRFGVGKSPPFGVGSPTEFGVDRAEYGVESAQYGVVRSKFGVGPPPEFGVGESAKFGVDHPNE